MTTWNCIAIAFAFACSTVAAQEHTDTKDGQIWLNAGGLSYHFNRSIGYNERNFGMGVEYKIDAEKSIVAGFYRNSVRTQTRYLGWVWAPIELGVFRAGAVIGVADGYADMRGGHFFPMALPALSYEGERYGVNFTVIPSFRDKVDGAMAIQFKVRIQ